MPLLPPLGVVGQAPVYPQFEGPHLPRRRLRTDGSQPIDVLMEIGADGVPHGVEDEVDPLAPGELGGRNEVAVAGDQHDLVDLALVGHGRDVETDAHVDAFLAHLVEDVLLVEIRDGNPSTEEVLNPLRLYGPVAAALVQVAEAQRYLALLPELLVELVPEGRHRCLREVQGLAGDGMVDLLGDRRAVVEEDAVHLSRAVLLVQVAPAHPVQLSRNLCRLLIAVDSSVAF